MKLLSTLCIITCIFTALPSHAQHWNAALKRAQKAFQQEAKKHPQDLQHLLERNIARAQAVQKAFAKNQHLAPAYSRFYSIKEPLGQYNTPLVYGWTMEENKLFISQRTLYEKYIRQLVKEKPRLAKELLITPAVPPARALAQAIPADKKYIFMGEYHNENLTLALQETLKEFVKLHPEKEIIVFSEFTDEWGFEQAEDSPLFNQYIAPLQEAGIRWVGLKEFGPLKLAVISDEYCSSVQSTLMGIKTRNEHWVSILKKWRQEHPNAVFVVHAGVGHVDYWEAFSVSARFPRQESFVLSFIPFEKSPSAYIEEPFHLATRYRFYRPGLLQWKTPRAAHLAGFDMQVILP